MASAVAETTALTAKEDGNTSNASPFVRWSEDSDETRNMLTINFNSLLTLVALMEQYTVIVGILQKCITAPSFSLSAPTLNEEEVCMASIGFILTTPRPLLHEELKKLSDSFQKLQWDVSLFDTNSFESVVLSESELGKVKCKHCDTLYKQGTGCGVYCNFDCRLKKYTPLPSYAENPFVG